MHNLGSPWAHKHTAGTKLEAGDSVEGQTLHQNTCKVTSSQGLFHGSFVCDGRSPTAFHLGTNE